MKQAELDEVLRLHKMWLENVENGVHADLSRADLSYADLRRANLSYADLRGADLSRANLRGANLSDANLRGADLSDADLRCANLSDADLSDADLSDADLSDADLRGADLRCANLRCANLDYSCLPLWCGGLHIKLDKRILAQIAYHFCNQNCTDAEYLKARNSILDFANQFHRVDECGILKANEPAPSANGTSSEENIT